MDPELRKHIKQADWTDLTKKLLRYVAFRLHIIYGGTGENIALPGGQSANDIVQEAIRRFLNGQRKWDPSRVSLLRFLMGIAKSLISHHHELKETQLRASGVILDTNLSDENDPSGTRRIVAKNPTKSPEGEILSVELRGILNQAFRDLNQKAGADEDYILVLMCIEEGIMKPADIAKETSLNISRVYAVKKRIFIDFRDILPES